MPGATPEGRLRQSGEVERADAPAAEQRAAEQDLDVTGGAGNSAMAAVLGGPGAQPPPDGRRGDAVTPGLLLRLQRRAGNGSVRALVGRLAVQRDDGATTTADVGVTGVTLSAAKVTIPLAAGVSVTATAAPANATGVTYSVEKGTVDPSDTTIDASTGAITIGASQPGGRINVKATAGDGSWATSPLSLVEKPATIASTGTGASSAEYGGDFTHTFNAASGKSTGLDGANINEKFDSLTAAMPWGGTFTLKANAAGSHGWDLNSGTMAGPDGVTIGKKGVDVGPFVKSASNPSPKGSLPQGFTMTQHLHNKSFPGGQLDGSPFLDVSHKRTLNGAKFVVEAGKGKIEQDYEGPAAVSNAAASPASVEASPPKPKTGTWNRTKTTVTADILPTTATRTFSITGEKLGCEVDSSGVVLVGDKAGTITVRVSGGGSHYDEVKITITEAKKPADTKMATEESEAEAEAVEPAPPPE